MANRSNDSTLSGTSSSTPMPGMSSDVINPGISSEEQNNPSYVPEQRPPTRETRGSGSDKNSDSRRLQDRENYLDKVAEDTFPASDPPSFSPMTGVGEADPNDFPSSSAGGEASSDPSHLPADFKDNPQAQFEYGRKSQKATLHFDRTSDRLERGNPDIGEVDLGTIEADKPAQPDDHDHYDSADDER